MSKRELLNESQFIDLSDTDLKEALGALWERLKSLKEAEKTDPDVEQMRATLKQYIKDNYSDEVKDVSKKLKAARVIAKSRGIRWKMPESKGNE